MNSKTLPRYDSQLDSPYFPISASNDELTYTQEQLNMRRKAEILNYNQQSSQTNNPTKSQKWSAINNRKSRVKVCANNPYKPTSTSSCDVPGPPMLLFLDPNVPLYNYKFNGDAVYNNSSIYRLKDWTYKAENDIEYYSNQKKLCVTISYNANESGHTIYRIETPLAINIQGNKNVFLGPLYKSVNEIEVKLNNIKCIPQYGALPVIEFEKAHITLPAFNFKVKLPELGGDFSATKYIGSLIVSNIDLLTQYQYVYQIYLSFNISITLYDSNGSVITSQSDTTLYLSEVLSNLIDTSDIYYYNVYNCNFVNASIPTFEPFKITSNPINLYAVF
jgi:hypothetical protein